MLSDEEAQAAKDKLERAIKEYYAIIQPGIYIDDWVLLVHKDSVELTANNESIVSHLTPTGQPFHRTVGLMKVAMDAELADTYAGDED